MLINSGAGIKVMQSFTYPPIFHVELMNLMVHPQERRRLMFSFFIASS